MEKPLKLVVNNRSSSAYKGFLSQKQKVSQRVVLLGMLFVSFLLISNLTAFKVVEINLTSHFSLHFPAGLFFFPLTYFFDGIMTEVYGFKMSRLIIWGGLVCCTIVSLCSWVAVALPASPVWDANTNHGAAAYAFVLKGSVRIFVASLIAYFCGEFLNSIIIAKLKVLTAGKNFPLRVLAGSAIGIAVDTIIFSMIAFGNLLPSHLIVEIILTQSLFKFTYEVVMLPVTLMLANHLKKVDHIDYYDTHTRFNPFSLRLAD